jgi:hypothetical protein
MGPLFKRTYSPLDAVWLGPEELLEVVFDCATDTTARALEAVVFVLIKSYLGQKRLSVLAGSSNKCRMKSSVFVVIIFCSWGRNDTRGFSRTGSTTCNALMVHCHAPPGISHRLQAPSLLLGMRASLDPKLVEF